MMWLLVLWHHRHKSMFCSVILFAYRQAISGVTVPLQPSCIFYYWYLFNLIENELNIKDGRRVEEQKKKPTIHWNRIWDAHVFNLIENELNVKDERRVEEQKKVKIPQFPETESEMHMCSNLLRLN